MFTPRWLTVLLSLCLVSSAQAQWTGFVDITSHNNGDQIINGNPNVTVTFTACTSIAATSVAAYLNGSSVTPQQISNPFCEESVRRRYTVPVTLNAGANTIKAEVCHNTQTPNCYSETITLSFLVPGVSVTPDGGNATAIIDGATGSHVFAVTNNGDFAATANLTCGTIGSALTSCTRSPSSVYLTPGASSNVTVGYTGAAVGSATATLNATYQEYSSTSNDGSVDVTVNPKPVATVQLIYTGASTLGVGQSSSLFTARTYAADGSELTGRTVTWTASGLSVSPTSGPSAATTTATGQTTGEGWVRATSEGAYDDEPITVVNPTYSLTYTLTPPNPKDLNPGSTSTGPMQYRIRNTSQYTSALSTFTFAATRDGIVSSCGAPSITSVELEPNGESDPISVTCSIGATTAPTSGKVTFTSTVSGIPNAVATTVNATPNYVFVVSASPKTEGARATSGSVTFTITNNSQNVGASTVVSLGRTCRDVLSCDQLPPGTNVSVPAGGSTTFDVSYNVSLVGTTGRVLLSASAGSYSKTDSTTIGTTADYAVVVTRTNASQTHTGGSTNGTVTFTVQNNSSNTGVATQYTLASSCTGPFVTACSASSPATVTLTDQQSTAPAALSVTYTTSFAGTSGNVTLMASATSPASQTHNATTTVNGPPVYSVTVTNNGAGTIGVGQTSSFSARTYAVDNTELTQRAVAWSGSSVSVSPSSGTSVAATTATGTSAGSATVTATSESVSGYAGITVVNPTYSSAYILVPTNPNSPAPGATSTGPMLYRIRNTSQYTSAASTFTFSATPDGIVSSCGTPSITSVALEPNAESDPIQLSCSIGATTAPTPGTVTFTATVSGIPNAIATTVNATPNYNFLVSASPKTEGARATTGSVTFTVTNNSQNVGGSTVITLSRSCAQVVSCDPLPPGTTVTVAEGGGSTTFPVSYAVAWVGTTGKVRLTASASGYSKIDSTTIGTTPDYAVIVTRTAESVQLGAGATSGTATFTVQNNSTNTGVSATYNFTPTCSGPFVTACNGTPAPMTLTDQQSTGTGEVALNYYAGYIGATGSVKLKAATTTPGSQADSATTTVNATSINAVAVISEFTDTPQLGAGSLNATVRFRVKNTSQNAATGFAHTLAVAGASGITTVSCTGPSSTATLAQGDSTDWLPYSCPVGASGSAGNVALTATATSPGSHSGSAGTNLTILPLYTVSTVPASSSATVLATKTLDSLIFTVTNTSRNTPGPVEFSFSKTCGPVVSCPDPIANATLAQGADTTIKVKYPVSLLGTQGTIAITASASTPQAFQGTGSATIFTTPSYGVTVTRAVTDTTLPKGTTAVLPTFTVKNESTNTPSGSATFTMTADCLPIVVCTAAQGTLTLADTSRAPHTITATSINLTGQTGFAKLTATAGGLTAKDSTKYTATPDYIVVVQVLEPSKPLGQRPPPDSTRFRVQNNSTNTDGTPASFTLSAACSAPVSCTFPQETLSLAEGVLSDPKWVNFTVGSVGTQGTVQFTAAASASFTGSGISTVTPTPAYSVDVTPTPTSRILDTLTSAGTITYDVRNTSANTPGPLTFGFTAACTNVVACNTSQGSIEIAQDAVVSRTVSISVDSVGTGGTVTMIAAASTPQAIADTGATAVSTTPYYRVAVTPDLGSQTLGERATSGFSAFKVRNTSWNTSGPVTFALAPTCTLIARPASCAVSQPTVQLAQNAESSDTVSYSVDSVGTSGTAVLTASATVPVAFSDTATTALTATPSYTVAVTPGSGSQAAGRGTTQTFSATLTNTSWNTASSIAASLSASSCSNTTIGNCSLTGNGATLAQGQSSPATFAYEALANGSETIALNAAGSVTGGSVTPTNGSLAVTVSSSGTISATTAGLNPGTTIDRGDCLTIAAGQNAAYECGDLRIVQPLPATTTMGKTRSPTLIYNSRHAKPGALLAANVTYTGVAPLTLQAQVSIAGQPTITKTFNYNSVCQAQACRIVVPVEATATMATGVYAAQLQVSAGSGPYTYAASSVVTDTIVIVNRATSKFGTGWWLDGFEMFVSAGTAKKLWIGGDGSTRLYTRSGSDTTVYTVTPAYDRPDTLKLILSSPPTWRRQLGNGAYVEFDNSGKHTRTVNSLGWATLFTDHFTPPNVLLESITLPVPAGSSELRKYTFGYQFDSQGQALTGVTSPNASFSRAVTVSRTNFFLLGGMTDADGSTTSFVYDANGRITKRINKLSDTTFFEYDDAGALKQARLSTARTDGAGAAITTTFRAAETRSAADTSDRPTLLSKAYSQLNGPRTDVGDTTNFYVNRWGAPDTVVNALGQRTRVVRDTVQFPALVARSIAPSGFEQRAYYNARALLDSTVALNSYGDGRNAKTSYVWHSTFSKPVLITAPTGEQTSFGYLANSLTEWRQLGPDAARRDSVLYRYNWQVAATVDQFRNRDSVFYDNLGNVSKTRTAIGFVTEYSRDALGRDTLVLAPTDSAQTGSLRQRMRTRYGASDRVDSTVKIGPVVSYTLRDITPDTALIKPDSLFTRHTYDVEGKPTITKVATSEVFFPEPGVVVQDDFWDYDAAGRARTHRRNLDTDSTFFDVAGNVIRAVTKGDAGFTQAFDVLNRPLNRITAARTHARKYCEDFQTGPQTGIGGCLLVFPAYYSSGASFGYRVDADTASFTYDAAGNMMAADNHDARVRRGYFPNGALRGDTSWIREPQSSNFFTSRRLVAHSHYDMSGRRDTLTLPDDSKVFAYNYSAIGALQSIVDPTGTTYRYVYDLAGRVDSISINADSVVEKRWYDADHRQNRRMRVAGGIALTDETLHFDAQGRIRSAYYSTAVGTWSDSTNLTYSGLGAVIARERISLSQGGSEAEEFRVDGLGNVWRSRSATTGGGMGLPQLSYYGKRGVLNARKQLPDPNIATKMDSLTQVFDADGHLAASHQLAWSGTAYTTDTPTRYYYGNDGKLHAMQRHASGYGAWEEYRYDALGRRVMVIVRGNEGTTPGCSAAGVEICNPPCAKVDCESKVTAQYWDGDQLIKEKRTKWADDGIPNVRYGIVHYVHGLELDQPLAVLDNRISGGSARMLNTNWRGTFESSVSKSGAGADCTLITNGTCLTIAWPANGPVYQRAAPIEPTNGIHAWSGSLLADGQDASGNLYRRNRYYDPVAGRFTQEDPIGLAGGMNLYGFAGGDPINHSDPFGLCPMEVDGIPCTVVGGVAGAVGGAIVGGLVLGGGGTLVLPVGGTIAGGAAGVLGGSIIGFGVGSTVGAYADLTGTALAIDWAGVKGKITRGISGIAVVGGILAGGTAGGLSEVWVRIQRARAEAEALKRSQDEERKKKEKEQSTGPGGSGGGDPPERDNLFEPWLDSLLDSIT